MVIAVLHLIILIKMSTNIHSQKVNGSCNLLSKQAKAANLAALAWFDRRFKNLQSQGAKLAQS